MLLAQFGHALAHACLPFLVLIERRMMLDQRGDLIDKARDILDIIGLLGAPQEQRLGSLD